MSFGNDGNQLIKLETDLHINKTFIKQSLGDPDDLIITPFFFCKTPGYFIYISCLTDEQALGKIAMLIQHAEDYPIEGDISHSFSVYASRISNCFFAAHTDEVIKSILEGQTVFLFDGHDTAVIIDNKAGEKRTLEEPTTEALIRGPRVGFREDIATNVALLRQQLPDHNLRFKTFQIGRRAERCVKIAYLEDVTNPYLIEEA
ncbi:MAG TPA: spore germination protein, partial [Bacillus sp. (in: firmicutes)]|nr:spore germination protein [Bacillus sp. (in: firmicutes)]